MESTRASATTSSSPMEFHVNWRCSMMELFDERELMIVFAPDDPSKLQSNVSEMRVQFGELRAVAMYLDASMGIRQFDNLRWVRE